MKKYVIPLVSILFLIGCKEKNAIVFKNVNIEYGEVVDVNYPKAISENLELQELINQSVQTICLNPLNMNSYEELISEAKTYSELSFPYQIMINWYGHENKDYISLNIEHYTFTGGAHGGTTINILTLDKQNGDFINVYDKITDLEKLRKILIEEYISQNNIDTTISAGEVGYFIEMADLPVPQTMELTPDGLKVYYGEYEIASHAVGITWATIGYDKLKEILPINISDFKQIELTKDDNL